MMSRQGYNYGPGFWGGCAGAKIFNFKAKTEAVQTYVDYMLCRTQAMFEYEGLPDTIPQRNLELMLQTNGSVCIAKVEGELYAFTGGPGGEPDPYYMPTIYVVANPALNLSETYKIGEDCVIIPSDSLYKGLLPMFNRYATLLMENDISMKLVDINARTSALVSASDDRTLTSAKEYLKKIDDGDQGVIAESAFFDGVRAQPVSSSAYNYLQPLIEYHQYLKASWLNDIGLNANFNMKREALNSSESALNSEALLPFVDDMLHCRELALEKVNAMFGTNISVKLSSSWEDNQEEVEAEHQALLAEANPEPAEVIDDDQSGSSEPETETVQEQESEVLLEAAEVLEEVAENLESEEVSEDEDVSDEAGGGVS